MLSAFCLYILWIYLINVYWNKSKQEKKVSAIQTAALLILEKQARAIQDPPKTSEGHEEIEK